MMKRDHDQELICDIDKDKLDTLDQEALGNWACKTELERTLQAGIHGAPEIKREEKALYLGVFRERVIKILTKGQVMEDKLYPEIIAALQDKRAAKLLIDGDIPFKFREKYQEKAQKLGIDYTTIFDPSLKGNAGLVVAGDQAVDVEDIHVP